MSLQWKRYHSSESLDDEATIEVTVVRHHWKHILKIFQKSFLDQDDINHVVLHFQYAINLLTKEVSEQNRPGPILLYFIAESLLDTFFIWSLSCPEYASELKYHQLRSFEQLLSRSQHELLFHKQIFKPLLNLLRSCESSSSASFELIEKHMIVVLNQICVSITKNPQLLEFCFDISAQHGPSRFIIFSLLIPFVHRDGLAGQQARDALLLMMQLSHRNDSVARYIVEQTNFCPILATGLSALYSELPRRLTNISDEWLRLNKTEWAENSSMVQFMNSLQFCNDVIQIAHSSIAHHLLQYIYHGFLVPVLGPSIYQNLYDIPVKFIDLQQFSNTMDEVIAATAYLDLFLRTIHEPALLKIFLRFILCSKIDNTSLLETLIQRVQSTSKLALVSLELFYTLINLNCEDIMYRLIFIYLIPCRHVMCSQRRYITDVEIYGKNAERFLSLKPSFMSKTNETIDSDHVQSKSIQIKAEKYQESPNSIELYQYRFAAYLQDAHATIRQCRLACQCWTAPYDGENPSTETVLSETDFLSLSSSFSSLTNDHNHSKSSDLTFTPTVNSHSSSKTAVSSNDSGIQEDGLDPHDPMELREKSSQEKPFELPAWLANNQPIPDEVLAQRALNTASIYPFHSDQLDDDDEMNDYHPSSFYAFSFVDLNERNTDDTCSTHSSTFGSTINSEIRLCMETLQTCLNHFREMNEHIHHPVDDEEIGQLLTELIDQVDTIIGNDTEDIPTTMSIDEEETESIDENFALNYDLLEEFWRRKFTFHEYLTLLDQLVDHQRLKYSSKSAEHLYHEILRLNEQIDQYRPNALPSSNLPSFDSSLPNTITSMDMSFCIANDSSTSNIATTCLNTTLSNIYTSINNEKPADIGPFLSTILSKLENMLHNSLTVNLLLTGIIARLAHYSQPLLRSFLLNHSLVLDPNIKSLYQILAHLKMKLEAASQTFDDFESLLIMAHEKLYQREHPVQIARTIPKRPNGTAQSRSKSVDSSKERSTKRNRIWNFFRGRHRADEREQITLQDDQPSQIILIDHQSTKFVNRSEENRIPSVVHEWDDPKNRQIAYCAVIFNEFLKELAAITLEHSVQQFDDDQIFDDRSIFPLLF